jgi:mannan endo-1,4-beta-mannosidase
MAGREPALLGSDIAGFHPEGSDIYHEVMKGSVARVRFWWEQKGGVIQLLYHWGNPMHPRGSAWKGRPEGSTPPDIGKMVTAGTEEYKTFHEKLSYTADYLEELAEARVPLLFAPLHEIDGGWFWWTDVETPENTAALYRQMFDYLVNKRGLHNLIWVYHAAHSCNRIQGRRGWDTKSVTDEQFEEEVAFRRRYYPGDEYVDIASLSTYGNRQLGWGHGWADARARAYELMQGVAPGKPLAVNETSEPIHPLMAQEEGLSWLWSRVWHGAPVDWMRYTFNHPHMITLDELPLLHEANVMPNVRIDWPDDGQALERKEIHVSGTAADRNGNLKEVQVFALHGPWLDWGERSYGQVMELVEEQGVPLGTARIGAGGRWAFTWADAPVGHHQLVALARDSEGAAAHSNVARITAGLDDLARGREVTAATTSPWGGPPKAAVDGNAFSSWWADHREPDPQWLQVDLGAQKRIGAVSVLWWKAYATHYTVQVSTDGENWQEAARVEGRQKPLGDADIVRFDPVQARYVRLHFTERAVTWQAYCVYRFAVYEDCPARGAEHR